MWFLSCLVLLLCGTDSLDKGAAALAEFRAEEALGHLDRARGEGPYAYADHVRLHEQLGIAFAYLDRKDEALRAFDMLLALDPGHAIGYTLSPKVTFLFERSRRTAGGRPAPAVELSWPRGLRVSDGIPVDIEVVADPRGFLRRATLFTRLRGAPGYGRREVVLPPAGRYARVDLPPAARASTRPEVLQLYLVARDDRGHEVLLVGSAERPREIALTYEPPTPWYRRWWVWVLVGSAVAGGTGLGVYLGTRELPGTIGGVFRVEGLPGLPPRD